MKKLSELILKAAGEVANEHAAQKKNDGDENDGYMDPLAVNDPPWNPGCRPCSQGYWERRRDSNC